MNLQEFTEYFFSFYGTVKEHDALYPETLPGLTVAEVHQGMAMALANGREWGGGDTSDRENVRDEILNMRELKKPKSERVNHFDNPMR